MNEESHNYKIDPDLEVRIVALVMGEVSAFESDRLLALMESNPEIAAFKAQLESTHGLMQDVAIGEYPDVADPWKLSDERRQKLLLALDGNTAHEPPATKVALATHDSKSWTQNSKWSVKAIAACISATAVIGLVAIFVVSQSLLSKRQSSYSLSRGAAESAKVESSYPVMPSISIWPNSGSEGIASDGETDYVLSDLQESTSVNGLSSYRRAAAEDLARFGKPMAVPGSKARPSAVPGDTTTWNIEAAPMEDNAIGNRTLGLSITDRSAGNKEIEETSKQNDDSLQPLSAPITLQLGIPAPASREHSSAAADPFGYRNPGGMGGAAPGWDKSQGIANANGVAIPPLSAPQSLSLGEPANRRSGSSGIDYGSQFPVGQGYGLPSNTKGNMASDGFAEGGKYESPNSVTKPFSTLERDEGIRAESRSTSAGDLGAATKPGLGIVDNSVSNKPLGERERTLRQQHGSDEMEKLKKSDSAETVSERRSLDLANNKRERFSLAEAKDSLGRQTTASLDEKDAKAEPFSTFSLHVSDVSFKLAVSALAKGEWPEAAKIRIEEFVNAFDYGDPLPTDQEKVACRIEQTIHPFLQQRNLLRVSMRTAAAGRTNNTPLRLTFLLDNSGSMERFDRQQMVRRAFALLTSQLQPSDQVTLISFARQPRLLADRVPGTQASQLLQIVENLPSEGGTNIEAALQLAFEKAREQQTDGAQNRIVLLTDGAVNLGNANPESLSNLITTVRDAGIAFDAAGISAEGLNDEVLEALARQGDGRYYLLDSLESCDDGFARQIAGALRPSAKNVKVQIEFNPKRVGRYKLLGFEKHLLKQEDFHNDLVDASEMAAAEAGVAVYQFEANPNGEGDVGLVSVRFRDLESGEMVENRWPIPYTADPPRPDQATPSMRIATCAALFAAKLRGDALGESVELPTLAQLLSSLPQSNLNATRVQQLQQMIEQARQMK